MPPEEFNDEYEVNMPDETDINIDEDEVQKIEDIEGYFKTIDSVPSHTPSSFFDQIIIYKNGTTRRLYWYDVDNSEWVYVAGTV